MKTAELQYDLPQELIAQEPAADRAGSRLMILNRANGDIREDVFRNLPGYLRTGDTLVLNDTRVIRARLHAVKPSGGRVEIFLLRELEPGRWEALVRPSARVKPGTVVTITDKVAATVEGEIPPGRRSVRFDTPDVLAMLEAAGEIPLPPYIDRDTEQPFDGTRYQTVYATEPGAVAAPTAGLHFTDELFDELQTAGIDAARLTLHVGYGTFKPIQTDTVEAHSVDPEWYRVAPDTAAMLDATHARGGRVIAVGTTSTRVLETCHWNDTYKPGEGWTNRYIYPPYSFAAVDALITNFHLPASSLLALVCAFAGKELVMRAYAQAIEKRFRFYSYGDAMLIL